MIEHTLSRTDLIELYKQLQIAKNAIHNAGKIYLKGGYENLYYYCVNLTNEFQTFSNAIVKEEK